MVVLLLNRCETFTMSRVGGLQLSKPVFDWGASDKLTELEKFKADCDILFNGPLCDLKEKQRAGLLVNWLGREATQILTSVESDVNTPHEVFETLEKVFRPESNQTLSRFKFRNMKQGASQNCDSYMSGLRLALPECKYRNDADELLKDQFIFGIYNKEIQDHLLGEIKETDNSFRALYEARKIESKLAQRKMLGIANPNLISVDELKKSTSFRGKDAPKIDCRYCGCNHRKGDCPAFSRECHKCGQKNHFSKMCKSSNQGFEKSESRHDSRKPRQANSRYTHKCRVHEINECQDDMEDLSKQVQSLFYS